MIKEPYVKLKEVIIDNPSVANIDESSILAGVINAPCGPDHLLVQGPKQFLKEFTVGNAIPRDANVTLINAYFCSFFAPILVKRAWAADSNNQVPIQMHDFSTMTSENVKVDSLPNSVVSNGKCLSLKYPTDLLGTDYVTYLSERWVSGGTYEQYDIVAYDNNYYVGGQIAGDDGGTPGVSQDWILVEEFDASKAYSIDDVVLYQGHIYKATAAHTANDPWNASNWANIDDPHTYPTPKGATQWTVGITTPDTWDDPDSGKDTKSYQNFGATPYGFLPSELSGKHLYVVYWYDAALGANATTDESAGYRLVSTVMGEVNPLTEREVYFEDILDSDDVPFNITSSAFTTGIYEEAQFGVGGVETDYNVTDSTHPQISDYKTAFGWFEDNSDVYSISYVSAFGQPGYEGDIAAACQLENTRWFYFCDVPFGTNDVSSVNTFTTGVTGDTYRTAVVGGWDKNSSVTGWVTKITPSSLILQKLYSNKNSNSEFAPLFDATNGTLGYMKPYKEFTKSQREQLLSNTYPTNWVKYDRTNNVYYMNDNRTHTRKINVMNEEMNVRMVNKIQRDVMLLVQRYKGMLNNVETRMDVVRVIDDYMNRYIMSQNYRPVEYRLVCDETNNTPDIINANKLAIELDVRIQGSIKFINILNKVFPLGVAFEE